MPAATAHRPVMQPGHVRFLIAALFGGIIILRDLTLLRAFSVGFWNDSTGYIALGWEIRTLPLPLLNSILNTSASPYPVILFQILVCALAVGALVFVVGRTSLVLSIFLGIGLALDLHWGMNNLNVLTESLFMSLHVLSAAVLVNQYQRRKRLSIAEIAAAGILFGWAFTIRPTGIFLIVPVTLLYLVIVRSWRRTAVMVAGFAAVMLVSASLNLAVTGRFQVFGSAGYYVAFPLFSYQIFAPDNGPASAELDVAIRECYPDVNYAGIRISTSNFYFWEQFLPCLVNEQGWSPERISSAFTQSYVEAIRRDPVRYASVLLENAATMAAYSPNNDVIFSMPFPREDAQCRAYVWCDAIVEASTRFPDLQQTILDLVRSDWLKSVLESVQLPRRLVAEWHYPAPVFQNYEVFLPVQAGVVALWGVFAIIGLALARPALRVLLAFSYLFIVYTIATVVAGHVFIARYALPLVPFYTIVTITTLYVVVERVYRELAARELVRPVLKWGGAAAAVILAITTVRDLGARTPSDTTVDWINTHIADGSQIAYESAAQVTIDTAILAPDARYIFLYGEPAADPDEIPRWISEGRNYLLVDSRTPMQNPSFEQRLQTLEAEAPVTLAFTNRSLWTLLGLGPEQAIYWLFEPQTPLDAVFDGGLRLIGYDVEPQPDGSVEILFYWYTQTPTAINYNYFIHVLDPATGEILAQADRQVGDYTHQTGIWRPGELVFDRVRVPAPEGAAIEQIAFGLYDLATGTRAAAASLDGTPLGDRFVIAVE
jgi:hypothetical protein